MNNNNDNFKVEDVVIPNDLNSDPNQSSKNKNSVVKLWDDATRFQYFYSMAGLVVGLLCIIGGLVLFLHGITGSTSWTAKFLGLESTLSDAAPGVVLFVIGFFIVWITRYSITSASNSSGSASATSNSTTK